jgi:hypothetical protein
MGHMDCTTIVKDLLGESLKSFSNQITNGPQMILKNDPFGGNFI